MSAILTPPPPQGPLSGTDLLPFDTDGVKLTCTLESPGSLVKIWVPAPCLKWDSVGLGGLGICIYICQATMTQETQGPQSLIYPLGCLAHSGPLAPCHSLGSSHHGGGGSGWKPSRELSPKLHTHLRLGNSFLALWALESPG